MLSVVLCGIYYVLWIYVLPRFGRYRIRQEAVILDNGAVSHKLTKVPLSELRQWDETHDAVGHEIVQTSASHGIAGQKGEKALDKPDF